MIADGRQQVNGALEAVERVSLAGGNHLEGEIVVVAADFALGHGTSWTLDGSIPPAPNTGAAVHGSPAIRTRSLAQPRRLKYCTARSCFSAAARVLKVPRLRRLPVL